MSENLNETKSLENLEMSSSEIQRKYKKFLSKKRKKFQKNIKRSNQFEESLSKLVFNHQYVDTELRDLFHRLNYQRVVDDLTKKISIWQWVLLVFALSTIFGLYGWATYKDTFVPSDENTGVLSDYEKMMSAIDLEVNWQKEGHQIYPGKNDNGLVDSTFVELAVENIIPRKQANIEPLVNATGTFWNVYFVRYLLIRVFITLVLIMLLSAGIKVYMRLRRDRMSLIYREEATTSIIYFIEKYMTTKKVKTIEEEDDTGNTKKIKQQVNTLSIEDKNQIAQLMPLIIKELYYNPDAKKTGDENQTIIGQMMQMMQNLINKAIPTKTSTDNLKQKR